MRLLKGKQSVQQILDIPDFSYRYRGKETLAIWSVNSDKDPPPKSFYTDANGYELVERNTTTLGQDGQPKITAKEKPGANRFEKFLYPVTSAISFKYSHDQEMVVVKNDRMQAGGVFNTGNVTQLALLVDRKLTSHDNDGINVSPPVAHNLQLKFEIEKKHLSWH